MTGKKYLLAALLLALTTLNQVSAQVCDCLTTGNCPVAIEDNGTFQGTLDVTVSGPNDLGQCPLTSLCFSITHTWVGDLAVTLTSPSGINYLVMADANNGSGGCGTDSDNIDVCIVPGTGNALTNNTEYMCNTGACQSGTCCLVGNWTMPCGGVTDPITGANQAPNCDLNDFNVPGNPANGTWTLTVNDICGQDVGTLNNFSLTFACGISSCTVCAANGGTLTDPDVQGCIGDPDLNLNVTPQYTGGNQSPNPGEYSYAWVVSQNGNIQSVNSTPDMSNLPPGIYTLCGFSYINTAAGLINSLIGMDLGTVITQFNSNTAPFCGDFSDDCMQVTIGPAILPTFIDTALCIGECIEVGFQPFCSSGSITLQSYLGCDSVVNVIITPISPVFSVQNVTVCQGECIFVNGQQYCPPAPAVFTVPSWQGCDSTVTILFNEVITVAIINPPLPPPISCSDPAITLDGLSSIPTGASLQWTGPNGFNSNQPFVTVNVPGTYTLTVTNNATNPPCTAQASVDIVGEVEAPDLILNSAPPVICAGQSFDLTTLNIVDLNNTNPVLTFHSGTPTTPANELMSTIVSPATTTTYYVRGTVGGCYDELPVTLTVNPLPVASFTVTSPICINGSSTVTFTGTAPPGATFNWNFGGGTAVPGTGPGPHTVTWASGGAKTITLIISANGCTSGTATQTVNVGIQIPAPILNCASTSTEITFTWNPVPGASGYNVTVISGPTGVQIDPTTYLVANLLPNQQVTISVEAISGNACPNSSAQITCAAQDCPPVTVTIDPVADICLTASTGTIQLVASQSGGDGSGGFTWSGPGVNPITGVFNPANANPGANTIAVSYEEGTCVYNESIVVNVFPTPTANFSVTTPICSSDFSTVNYTGNASNAAVFTWDFDGGTANPGTGPGPHQVNWSASGTYTISLMVAEDGCQSNAFTQTVTVADELPAPQITCVTTTNSVEFFWNNIPGAGGFDVNVINGGTGTATSDTSMLFSGLNPGDDITIQVITLDPGPCADASSQVTCIAQDCPAVTIDIAPVPNICLDASTAPIDLQATVTGGMGGGTLIWSGLGVSLTGTFDPLQGSIGANTITVTYTEGDCIYTEDIVVNVFAQPLASFNAASPVCVNNDISVSYTGTVLPGIQFNWDFGTGMATPGTGQGPHLVGWTSAGAQTISLTVTTAQGCVSEPFSSTVQVDPILIAPAITCVTSTTSIEFNWPDVAGATNYQVMQLAGAPGSQTSQNAYLITGLVPNDQATISLTVSNGGACPPVTVEQTCIAQDCPPISVSVNPTASICVGAATPVQLTATVTGSLGTGTGVWSGLGVDSTGLFTAATAGVGAHTVTYVYTENSCTYLATGVVVVFSEPSATFAATPTICIADAATVTYTGNASPNANYIWDFGGGTATPGTGPGPHQVTFPTTGVFDISLTVVQSGCNSIEVINSVQVDPELVAPDIDCTTTTESIVFNWNTVPNVTDYEVQVVTGQTGSLTSQTSYTVNGLMPNDQVTIELTVIGNTACPPITVTETCIAQDCPPVTIDLPPVDPICLGSTVGTMQLQATVTGGSGTSGTWSGPGTNASGVFDPNTAGVGIHTITFVYQENANCSYDGTLQIEVVAPPVADAGADGKITCDDTQTSIQLGGNGSSTGPNITYGWSMTGGSFPGDSTILFPTVAEAGTYTLTVTNTALLGCSATDVVEVTASQDIPQPQLTIVPVSCFGQNDGAISVVSVTGGQTPYLYSLNGAAYASTSSFQPLTPGVYVVSVIDAAGCEASVTIDISQPQELNVELVAIIEGGGNIVRLGDTTELQALISLPPDSLDNITWYPQELVSCDTCLNTFVSPTAQTTFTITVESNGCVDSDELTLFVKKDHPVYIPNAFSPNADGLNDVFMIYAGKQVTKVKSFLIFDRWGETVFQFYDFQPNDPDHGWDGTYRNDLLNAAVFTWFAEIEFIDGSVELYEGDVTLMR
ncbi:MAG: gliding motility-associated C-terminal domain-containing protein [Saprospiraceae bacterium]|nr:gliding motility-associated C-terminal domain-containing protein [Saprospiraceae bacterium]